LSEIHNNDLSLAHSMPPGAVHTNKSESNGQRIAGREFRQGAPWHRRSGFACRRSSRFEKLLPFTGTSLDAGRGGQTAVAVLGPADAA
jgi:hypothetical protein